MTRSLCAKAAFIVFTGMVLTLNAVAAASRQEAISPEQYRQQLQDAERSRLTQAERLDLSRYLTRQLYIDANDAQDRLDALARKARAFFDQMELLLDSDQGKRIVRDPATFMTYYELHTRPALSLLDLDAKLNLASALANRLQLALDGPDVGYVPTTETQDQVHDLRYWVKERAALLDTQQSSLNTILRSAPADLDLSTAKTLRTALEQYRSRWPQMLAESRVLGEQLAADDARQTLIDAVYTSELESARAEARRIRDEMQAKIDTLTLQFQVDLLKLKQENERALAEANEKYKDTLAELQRLRQQGDVERTVADIEARIGQTTQLDQARQEQLKALARSPEVQRLLAPFLAHGSHQPGQNVPAYEKGPVSLSRLNAMHALRPTQEGLRALLTAGTAVRDTERPRWTFPKRLQRLSAQELDQLRQAQQYLIDLGSVMVELGMLAP